MNDLVSIIVPCYNQARFLPETLDSVLAQTHINWECIIVNDGSPDNTEDVAKKYCNIDNRFKYTYKVNGGLSSARNLGLMLAKGEFVQFLDSDDVLGKHKIYRQVNNAILKGNDIEISGCYMFENSIRFPFLKLHISLSDSFQRDILLSWDSDFTIPIHCALFRRSLFVNNGILFDINLKAKEDWFMWFQISSITNKVYIDDFFDVFYRWHSSSMSKDYTLMLSNQLKAMLRIYNDIDDLELKSIFGESMHLKIAKQFQGKSFKLARVIETIYGHFTRPIRSLFLFIKH